MKKQLFLLVMMLVAMTFASCSNNDNNAGSDNPTVNDPTGGVTVHVGVYAGIDAAYTTTRSNVVMVDGQRTLRFAAAQGRTPADRLFVCGELDDNGTKKYLAGYLDMDENTLSPDGKSALFSGALSVYGVSGAPAIYNFVTADPISECTAVEAHLVAGGFNDGFFKVDMHYAAIYDYKYSLATGTDYLDKTVTSSCKVVSKTYTTANGFTGFQGDAILDCTISGLTADQNYVVELLSTEDEDIYKTCNEHLFDGVVKYETNVKASGGVATFALSTKNDGDSYFAILIKDAATADKRFYVPLEKMSLVKNEFYNVTRRFVDLTIISNDSTLQDNDIVTGTLGANVKISVADGATVTLEDVAINGVEDSNYQWAGISCLGDANIVLSGTNTLTGFGFDNPGIFVPKDFTLTISGAGALETGGKGISCGIGGGFFKAAGNIVINGGNITSHGHGGAASIGAGSAGECGNITINGGNVTADAIYGPGIGVEDGHCGDITITGGVIRAYGGRESAGIGCGGDCVCGKITIESTVTSLIATMGEGSANCIGIGYNSDCGTITIGGIVYWDGSNYQNGGETYLTTSPFYFPQTQ